MSATERDTRDLERNIGLLCSPFGGDAHAREREQAAQWLLAHADVAHARLVELLTTGTSTNPAAIAALLPRFGRDESVIVLARLLESESAALRHAAGQALAQHPSTAAKTALQQAMKSKQPAALVAAADGLMARGDPSVCDALRPTLAHADATVRYHALQAASRLGCATAAELARLAKDADADVRALAVQLRRRATK